MNALNSVKDYVCKTGNAIIDINPLKETLFAIKDGVIKIGATALSIITAGAFEKVNTQANLPSGAHKILTGPYLYVAKIINPNAVFTNAKLKENVDDNDKVNSSKKSNIPSGELEIEDENDVENKKVQNLIESSDSSSEESVVEISVVKAGIFTRTLTLSLLAKATDAANGDNSGLSRHVYSRGLFALTIPVAAISAIADMALGVVAAAFSILCLARVTVVNTFAFEQLSSITGLGISAKGFRGFINPSQFQPVLG